MDILDGMRVAVTGGRDYDDAETIERVFDALPSTVTIINGGCRGADFLCMIEAKKRGMDIEIFRADWERYGKSAGPIRNSAMVDTADMLIAFEGGKGTANCIRAARAKGIPVIRVTKGGFDGLLSSGEE